MILHYDKKRKKSMCRLNMITNVMQGMILFYYFSEENYYRLTKVIRIRIPLTPTPRQKINKL